MISDETSAPDLRVCVLDAVSVASAGRPAVAVGSLQQKTLLTLLVAAKGRSVSLDSLADELWPDERPARWKGCLATLASSVRKAAGDPGFIVSTARGYTLHRRPERVHTDVEELLDCLDQARAAQEKGLVDVAETMARRAVALYGTGPWTSDYWGWSEAAAEAAFILATALNRRRAYVACIAELSGSIVDFDWHDGLWACLIDAHREVGNVRRATEVAQEAMLAVGGETPLLARAVKQMSGSPTRQAAFSPSAVDDRPVQRSRSLCRQTMARRG